MDAMKPREVEAVIKFAQAGLVALSERVLTLLSLAGCVGAFGYTMLEPRWERLAAACLFALLVFWPCMRLESSKRKEE